MNTNGLKLPLYSGKKYVIHLIKPVAINGGYIGDACNPQSNEILFMIVFHWMTAHYASSRYEILTDGERVAVLASNAHTNL